MKGSSFRRVDASTLVILMSALALATVVATGACDYHVVIGWHDWGQGRAGSGGAAGLGGASAGSGGAAGLGGGSAGSGGATGLGGGRAGSGGATGLGGGWAGSGGAGGGSGGAAGAIALFLPPVAYPIGRRVGHIALGDLNGDLRPDIAVVSYPPVRPDGGGSEPGPRRVDVFLSAGASEYTPAQTYAPGERPFLLAVGDIDGDGQGDLVVTDLPGVSVLFNNGGGALRAPISLDAGHYPVGLALADLNDDGRTDIVVANASVDYMGGFDLLLNLGGGTFARAIQKMDGSQYAMALGDLDGNASTDIAAVNQGIDVLLNTGDGTFGPLTNYAPPRNSSDSTVAIGDLNGDGKPDLAVTNRDGQIDRTSVRFNVGDRTFAAPVHYVYDRASIDAIAINDVNGDGLPDLVTNWSYSALAVLLNQGAGVFGAPIRVDVSTNYFALGDLNRDGRLDIVTTTDTGIAIVFGRR